MILLHVVHPDEERLPDGAAYRFTGMENDGSVDASPREIRADLRGAVRGPHGPGALDGPVDRRATTALISTATPYLQTLGQFLVDRSG